MHIFSNSSRDDAERERYFYDHIRNFLKRARARDPPVQVPEQDCHLGLIVAAGGEPLHFCVLLSGAQEDPDDSDFLTLKEN